MAHHVYQTEAIILKGMDTGESNRFVDVFSRELGLVRAAAQSARREYSKMRYSLIDHSILDISLVRGKQVWRITGAKERFNAYHALKGDEHKLLLFKRVNSILKRLVHGEEKNEELFETVLSFIQYLKDSKVSKDDVAAIECLIVMRILFHLGYISEKEHLLEEVSITSEAIEKVKKNRKEFIAEINEALRESQL